MTQATGPIEPAPADDPDGFGGMHGHSDVSGGWLRAAVFGAMDGLVTTIGIVAGVGGAGGGRDLVLLAGAAGVVAGAFSMALGEFASVEAQNDAVGHEVDVEREEIRRNPAVEQAELAESYEEMGLTRRTAEAVAREVHGDPELAVRVHITQELGLDPEDRPSPWTAAVSSFLCFAVGGIIPLLPYLLGYSSLPLGLLVGGVGLFAVGALTSRFTTRTWWFAGIRQVLFGAVAAGATYGVGAAIGVTL